MIKQYKEFANMYEAAAFIKHLWSDSFEVEWHVSAVGSWVRWWGETNLEQFDWV